MFITNKPKEEESNENEFTIAWWIYFLYVVIIFLISCVIGIVLSNFFIFNQQTLLWATSTIIQAFGAMIAIIITILIFKLKPIEDSFYENITSSLDPTGSKNSVVMSTDELREHAKEMGKVSKKLLSPLRQSLVPPILSITFLIIVALLVLLFTNSTLNFSYPYDVNVTMSVTMTFLIIYSIYCLSLLVFEILKLLKDL